MNHSEAIAEAAIAIVRARDDMQASYVLVAIGGKIKVQPTRYKEKDACIIIELTKEDLRNGPTNHQWNIIEYRLRTLIKEKVL